MQRQADVDVNRFAVNAAEFPDFPADEADADIFHGLMLEEVFLPSLPQKEDCESCESCDDGSDDCCSRETFEFNPASLRLFTILEETAEE